ncbi:hypothetical protein, partial [Endozoicomonas sp. SESOKO3]|uniref:hypothetical protein n=2 Tax=unclassified Endozoicomonas TaxID=2644528 RepID=UPI002148067D
MTHACPNALRLAVAVAISSSILGTQALTERRLQTKSIDIQGNGHAEFTHSEVIVKPTLGHNQQPIPKSITTTYPDQTQTRAGYEIPSEGFTNVLSGISGGVSSIDLFETDKDGVAQKYTKVLKAGNEGIFKITHNLAEEVLVIEVRNGMTSQDSIKAVRSQSGDIQPLEPTTKIASPNHLVGVLKGANERAGSLGEVDHYVALATIEVDKIEVNSRTFMRLVAADDEPPDLQSLDQALFVNDEPLLAAATSAYTQVHTLREGLQQKALDDLLYYHKPVGYVVNVGDEWRACPVPEGYPKLEVTEAPGEIIVFHGQKQNPTDVAFVEKIFDVWKRVDANTPAPGVSTQVKKDKIKSYQYVIRSRQMELLEGLAARHDVGVFEDHDAALMLAYYEILQQALTAATPDHADEFYFSVEHVKFASSFITPPSIHNQLAKHFSFKPALRDFLTNPHFVRNFLNILPFAAELQTDNFYNAKPFADKIMADMAREMIENQIKLEEQRAAEGELIKLRNQLRITTEKVTASEMLTKETLLLYRQSEDARARLSVYVEELVKEVNILDVQQKSLRNEILSMRAPDDEFHKDQLQKNQALEERIAQFEERIAHLEERIAQFEVMRHNRFHRLADLKPKVDDITTPDLQEAMPKVLKTLSAVEKALEIHYLDENDDLYLRRQGIAEDMQEYIRDARQRAEEEARYILEVVAEMLNINVSEEDDKTSKLTRIFSVLNSYDLSDKILGETLDEIDSILWRYESKILHAKDFQLLTLLAHLHYKLQDPGPNTQARDQQTDLLEAIEKILNIKFNKEDDNAVKLARVHTILDGDDVSGHLLDQIDQTLRKEDGAALNERDLKLNKLRAILHYKVKDSCLDMQVKKQQASLLGALERELNIYPHRNAAAEGRGKATTVKLAKVLNVAFEQDDDLAEQKGALSTKIQELFEKSDALYDDEAARRVWNNEMAHQLNIEDYKEDATIEDQNSLVEKKLQQLNKEVFNAGQPDVNERLTAIEKELDRQIARLGPKPRYVLDREVATARRALEEAESNLRDVHRELKTLRGKHIVFAGKLSDLDYIPDKDDVALNQLMKKLQTDLGLTAGDEQTSEERVEDIRHFLQEYSAEKRDEITEKLRAKHDLNLLIKEGDLSTLQNTDYIFSVTAHKNNHDPDETGILEEALNELPLAKKNYAQVTKFLRDRDRKCMDLTSRWFEKRDAQENLDRKKQENIDFGDSDEKAKSVHKNEMAKLDWILKQKNEAISKAEDDLADYDEAFLDATEEAVDLKPDTSDTFGQRMDALRNKQLELGGKDGNGGKIRQLMKQARLEEEIEIRKADIRRRKEVLNAAETAVESDRGPFQYTLKQAKIRAAMDAFMQQHSLKQQALEAAIGLAELAAESGKTTPFLKTPFLTTCDFDDEFAPIRLQAMVGDKLTFKQASRIVEVFKSLKATFPEYPSEPEEEQPRNALEEVRILTYRARNELKTGAQQYDNEIYGMGKRAIHFVEHEPENLKSFSEYFATHSASGDRIIALVRDGLISKIELESYMKAVRGVDGYQTVDEFEHFLGYKHGVNLPDFRKVVQMLSDKGAEEFMQSAFAPTITATGPTGMKESVAGMKEYAAAVIANYVLDDIAFENGHRTAAFLANVQDTLTPYASAVGVSESDLIHAIHDTLMQAHAAAVKHQFNDYWVKPSASLVQAVTWYYSNYRPLLVTHSVLEAARLSLSNMAFLYLLDLTNRGDYTHRMLSPFRRWLERFGIDLDRTGQYACHSGIEKISEAGGLAMPLGKAASSVILLKTGSLLFARQYNANPRMYRSI